MGKKVYAVVVDDLVKRMESGVAPWVRPWSKLAPASGVSQKPYRGINALVLGTAAFASPYWFTFKQAAALGGTVRKGEHGMPVVFWKFPAKGAEESADDAEADEPKRGVLCRYYRVFNFCQCEGLKLDFDPLPLRAPLAAGEAHKKASDLIAAAAVCPIRPDLARAFYSPSGDYVGLPGAGQFVSQDHYYATLFHEVAHATGHPKRLGRFNLADLAGFGSPDYADEELVAEIAAAMLAAEVGLDEEPLREQSAAYLQGWAARAKREPDFLIHAAQRAQAAVDFVLRAAATGSAEVAA